MRVFEWGFGFIGYMVYLWMRQELPAVEAAAEEGGLAAEPESPAGSDTGTQKTAV